MEEPALWIIDGWSAGYFHWSTDVLPRLLVGMDVHPEALVLLPSSYQSLDYVRGSLAATGIASVCYIGRCEVLRVKELWLPTHTAPTGNYNEPLIREVRRRIRAFVEPDLVAPPKRRIYVSRALARRRRVRNETELAPILDRHGFEVVHLERLSWRAQIQLAMDARFMISIHGAGLTNMLFMSAPSAVMEIRASGDSRNNCYFSLASAAGVPYFYSIGNPADGMVFGSGDLQVDPRRFEDDLIAMLDLSASGVADAGVGDGL